MTELEKCEQKRDALIIKTQNQEEKLRELYVANGKSPIIKSQLVEPTLSGTETALEVCRKVVESYEEYSSSLEEEHRVATEELERPGFRGPSGEGGS